MIDIGCTVCTESSLETHAYNLKFKQPQRTQVKIGLLVRVHANALLSNMYNHFSGLNVNTKQSSGT